MKAEPFDECKGVVQEFVINRWIFLLFHLALLLYFLGVPAQPLGTLAVWFVMQVGVHAGYHRYFSHRSFRAHRWVEFLLGVAGCLALQSGPIWWASKHRHHHRYADTEQDHHSPLRSFWHAHIGWLLPEEAAGIDWRYVADLRRPIPMWIQSHQDWIHGTYLVAISLLAGWSAVLNLWIVPIVICWHTTFSTNSVCHLLGSRSKECHPRGACNARNNALVAIINLGEGWHNNHHANPALSHHGYYRWYQVDIVYCVLLVMEKLGMIWDLKRSREDRRRLRTDAR